MLPALEIINLKKVYSHKITAINNLSLKVEQGDFFGLLGPNGAGKTTIIGIITSLIDKTSGQIKVFGHDIIDHWYEARKCIGVVPQEFNFSQFEQVEDILINQAGFYEIPYQIAKTRTEYYLKKLGLWNKKNVQAKELSGGMKRRLMIARALVHEPRILLLDEPTAGVDIELRHSMWEFLSEINNNGITIILTTHYLEEAEILCKRIGIIDYGQLIECTNIKDFLNRSSIETIILHTKENYTELPYIQGFNIKEIDKYSFSVTYHKTENLNLLFSELSKHNIYISRIRNNRNKLEELFMNIVKK